MSGSRSGVMVCLDFMQGEPKAPYTGVCGWFTQVAERVFSFFSAAVRSVRDFFWGI